VSTVSFRPFPFSPTSHISESLGHNDLKTTENYLASFEREEREKNARLLTNFGD